jgi:hypothetical protein
MSLGVADVSASAVHLMQDNVQSELHFVTLPHVAPCSGNAGNMRTSLLMYRQ